MYFLANDLCLPPQHPDGPDGISASDNDIELVCYNRQRSIELSRKDSIQVGGILDKSVMTVAHAGQLSHQVFISTKSGGSWGQTSWKDL